MESTDYAAQALLGSVSSGWFAPNIPIGPMAPSTQGWARRFDYQQSVNLNVRPKAADGNEVTFEILHRLVERCDILSIALFSMLERISKYNGRVLDVNGDPRKPSKAAQAILEQMSFPDGVTPFATWMQTLGYDMAVTDNATVYIDRSGKLPRFRNVDGQTIAIRVNEQGDPAMIQQIIKGGPAHNYAIESVKEYGIETMVWCPKHRRANKVYGYSYVEQIRTTVTLALQRVGRQLDYFTSGNVPAMLIEAPSTWTPGMVREANTEWRDLLAGVSGKDEVQIMPNGMTPHIFERDVVKNDFDEWLARIICFQFSVPVTPLVKETNRATAEATQDASLKEGHASQLRWAADSLTKMIRAAYGPGFFWKWDTDSAPDSAMTSDLVKSGKLKPAALVRLGYETEEIADEVKANGSTEDAEGKKPAETEKIGNDVKNADSLGDSLPLEGVIWGHLEDLLAKAQPAAQDAFGGKEWAFDAIPSKGLVTSIASHLAGAAIQGADEASAKTHLEPQEPSDYERPALKFARDHAAEMVGMKWEDSKLIPNPDVEWQISDMARDAIKSNVSRALEENWSSVKLAEKIAADNAFSRSRASAIARDQIALAQETGSFEYFKAAGVTGKRWSEYDACSICRDNANQGVIPLNQLFGSGHMHAPAHPNCRCRIIPEELKNEAG